MNALRVVCVLFEPTETALEHGRLETFAEACFRFSPQIALGENCVFIEVGACAGLYSEASVLARVQVLLHRFSLRARVAVAGDVPTALSMATFRVAHKGDLPVSSLAFYANPFGADLLQAACLELDEVTRNLKRLGVGNLRAFCELPPKTLASRFGKVALLARHALDHACDLPWPRFVVSEKITERCDIDSAYLLTALEHLLFPLKQVCDRVASRLKGKGLLAGAVELRLVQQRYSTVLQPVRAIHLDLAFAQGSSLSLLSLLKERLSFLLQKEPLQAPIAGIELMVTRSVPGSAQQRNLFSNKEEALESIRSVVSRLVDKLGLEKVFQAEPLESYLPERSWKKTLQGGSLQIPAASAAPSCEVNTTVVPLRPLRVFSKPVPLRRIENFFVHPKKRWAASGFSEPQRVAAEWWTGQEERDYYRVKTAGGEELWVYWSQAEESYFLHGVYD